ncbi:MAG TPA: sterol desaturase family protein [Candidatus Baltobacteraceae bacterium]|nr:sterol desaturase family protein [Candidatus Baltobacteraceae bacterium]
MFHAFTNAQRARNVTHIFSTRKQLIAGGARVVPVTLAYTVAYYAATRSLALGLSLLLGNAIAMLYYEWVHYVAHIPYVPATAVGRWMKKYHLLHHYLNERLWYGVTNPSIDLLARTYMPAAEAERSTRTRVLYP